jgi:hypothetical protein
VEIQETEFSKMNFLSRMTTYRTLKDITAIWKSIPRNVESVSPSLTCIHVLRTHSSNFQNICERLRETFLHNQSRMSI